MKIRKLQLAGLILFVSALAAVICELIIIRPARARQSAVVRRSSETRAEIHVLAAQLVEAEAEQAKLREQIAKTQQASALLQRREEATTPAGKTAKDLRAAQEQLRAATQRRRELRRINAPFYRAVALTPEEIERVEDIQMESWQTQRDLWGAAAAAGLSRSDPVITTSDNDRKERERIELILLLGDDGYHDLRRYQTARSVALGTAERLYYTPDPLRLSTADQLTEILARHTDLSARPRRHPVSWDAAFAEAREILSPAQMIGLQLVRDEHEREHALARRVGEISQGLSKR